LKKTRTSRLNKPRPRKILDKMVNAPISYACAGYEGSWLV
jgi:hypothetical protein